MKDLGYYHPQLVHFAIVLCIVGVLLRLVALTGRAPWTNPAAALLLIAGGIAAYLTARAGMAAHGPIERIPGVAEAVQHHEDWGNRAKWVFGLIGILELVAVLVRANLAKGLRLVTALGGLAGLFVLYETGEHGGELVYEFGGGPGIRSGNPEDLTRLLTAGLFTRAMADRAAGDKEGAARLIDELARRMPEEPSLKWVVLESKIKDRGDPAGALAELRSINPSDDDRRAAFRKALLTADAYQALGFADSAKATLTELGKKFPDSPTVADAIAALEKK
jgi:uncharacterized membrane protein